MGNRSSEKPRALPKGTNLERGNAIPHGLCRGLQASPHYHRISHITCLMSLAKWGIHSSTHPFPPFGFTIEITPTNLARTVFQ